MFNKVIKIWGCTEPSMFLFSEQMSREAMRNEKEGLRKKQACSLALPPCLSDNPRGHQIIATVISYTSPTRIMNARGGGAYWSTCWGGHTGWLDLSFICTCLPAKMERRLLLPEGRDAFFNYREAVGAYQRQEETRPEAGPPVFLSTFSCLERTVLCASFSTSLKWERSCLPSRVVAKSQILYVNYM